MGLTKTATGVSFPWPIIMFLKVLGIHKGLFSKVPYAGVRGRAPRSSLSSLPAKLQFERERRIDAPQKAIHEYILFAFIYL